MGDALPVEARFRGMHPGDYIKESMLNVFTKGVLGPMLSLLMHGLMTCAQANELRVIAMWLQADPVVSSYIAVARTLTRGPEGKLFNMVVVAISLRVLG
jgi:hypothetical protein